MSLGLFGKRSCWVGKMSKMTKCDRAICQVITLCLSLGKEEMHFHFLLMSQSGACSRWGTRVHLVEYYDNSIQPWMLVDTVIWNQPILPNEILLISSRPFLGWAPSSHNFYLSQELASWLNGSLAAPTVFDQSCLVQEGTVDLSHASQTLSTENWDLWIMQKLEGLDLEWQLVMKLVRMVSVKGPPSLEKRRRSENMEPSFGARHSRVCIVTLGSGFHPAHFLNWRQSYLRTFFITLHLHSTCWGKEH